MEEGNGDGPWNSESTEEEGEIGGGENEGVNAVGTYMALQAHEGIMDVHEMMEVVNKDEMTSTESHQRAVSSENDSAPKLEPKGSALAETGVTRKSVKVMPEGNLIVEERIHDRTGRIPEGAEMISILYGQDPASTTLGPTGTDKINQSDERGSGDTEMRRRMQEGLQVPPREGDEVEKEMVRTIMADPEGGDIEPSQILRVNIPASAPEVPLIKAALGTVSSPNRSTLASPLDFELTEVETRRDERSSGDTEEVRRYRAFSIGENGAGSTGIWGGITGNVERGDVCLDSPTFMAQEGGGVESVPIINASSDTNRESQQHQAHGQSDVLLKDDSAPKPGGAVSMGSGTTSDGFGEAPRWTPCIETSIQDDMQAERWNDT